VNESEEAGFPIRKESWKTELSLGPMKLPSLKVNESFD
jgi:hypothetical protein